MAGSIISSPYSTTSMSMGRGAFLSPDLTRPKRCSIERRQPAFSFAGEAWVSRSTAALMKLGPSEPTASVSQADDTVRTSNNLSSSLTALGMLTSGRMFEPSKMSACVTRCHPRSRSISTPTEAEKRTAPGFSTRMRTFFTAGYSRHNSARSDARASTV